MAPRRRAGLVLAVAVAVCVSLVVSAAAAGAVYGLLGHYEVCSSDGDHAYLTSVSVRENVFVGLGSADDRVLALSQGGHQIASIVGTGQPGDAFNDPIVGTSAVGALYVIDNPDFSPRLLKFAGGGFEREFAQDQVDQEGNQGLARLRGPVAVFGTRPGGRGVAAGEAFVADSLEGIVVFEADGKFSERSREYSRKGTEDASYYGDAYPVGISAVAGVVGVAWGSLGGETTHVALLGAGSKPLRYLGSFDVGDHFVGIAGAPDNSWWVLRDYPAVLEHYTAAGSLIERVSIGDYGTRALAVAPDGKVWVARADGLLRIGQGGGVIPPNQYGRGKCGAPKVSASVPSNQQVIASRKLLVAARCSEQCTVRASGTLSVPGGAARTFKLSPAKRRLAVGQGARLGLGLSRKAAAALSRAKARGVSSTVLVKLRAEDAGLTRSSRQLRLTIG
jgi:hypothetical protein